MTEPSPAGRFRHRVGHFAVNAENVDDFGARQRFTTPTSTRWAAVEPVSAKEREEANAAGHDVTHRVRLRYFPELDASDELEFRGRRLRISSAINVGEADVEWLLLCHERQG